MTSPNLEDLCAFVNSTNQDELPAGSQLEKGLACFLHPEQVGQVKSEAFFFPRWEISTLMNVELDLSVCSDYLDLEPSFINILHHVSVDTNLHLSHTGR